MKNKSIIQYIHELAEQFLHRKIVANDKDHLKQLIKKEIDKNGYNCDLNHIDVSQIKDFSKLFANPSIDANETHVQVFYIDISKFNGDISKWNISNAKKMYGMFWESEFNGDISNWDVSNVNDMQAMFFGSQFNGDISKWNTENVENMKSVFASSIFNGDISMWNVSNVVTIQNIFYEAEFSGDISNWCPYKLDLLKDAFKCANTEPPYWAKFEDKEARINSINNYLISKKLNQDLPVKGEPKKRIKI
jgi:surface protein